MLGDGPAARVVAVKQSPLNDAHGASLGRLVLLRDVTEQKQAELRLLEEQRAVATLLERDRVARELHDSTGQILAYVNIQAQAIRKNIERGHADAAKAQLGQMVTAARLAHADVRETIFSLKSDSPADDRPFHERLNQLLLLYGAQYSIDTHLIIEDDLCDPFSPEASVQLLRVIQESLSNARRHGGAQHVDVAMRRQNHSARITITDDGRGFDITRLPERGHYGLSIMRERLAQIGATISIDSQIDKGTRVIVDAPLSAHREVTS
jgi:two-component system nitrate/nitrite sensor histidine kinase NarX